MNSTIDIFANADNSKCPDGCFRPVGLALDGKERLWMSSDSTGELYVLAKTSTSTATASTTSSGATPSSTKKGAAARASVGGVWLVGVLGVVASWLVI